MHCKLNDSNLEESKTLSTESPIFLKDALLFGCNLSSLDMLNTESVSPQMNVCMAKAAWRSEAMGRTTLGR